ncbi:MAG TPA: catalase family peroxidase [Janthinobacterium sp.]|nr:catalase family peroxidase [Janthinobacterium sp.]
MTATPARPPASEPKSPGAALRKALGLPPGTSFTGPLLAIAAVGAALGGAYAYAAGWLTPERLTPTAVVKTFNANFGLHPGFRRNHAKGICVTGYFEGNGSAAQYSVAPVFGATRTPVIGRFAIPGGNPSIADAASPVRSLALLFQLPNGEQWRTGMNNTPIFIVNNPQAFYANLLASKPDPATKKTDPAKLKAFFDAHPESASFRQWIKDHAPSSALTNSSYYGINAFRLVNAAGQQQYVRWSVVPEQVYVPLDAPAPKDPNFLDEDLQQQLQQGPVRWHLKLQLAQAGDVTDDATKAWPDERPMLDAGVLTLNQAIAQGDGPCRDVNFDPLILPKGIQPSRDPLLAARSAAYSRSFNARTREEAGGAVQQAYTQGKTR